MRLIRFSLGLTLAVTWSLSAYGAAIAAPPAPTTTCPAEASGSISGTGVAVGVGQVCIVVHPVQSGPATRWVDCRAGMGAECDAQIAACGAPTLSDRPRLEETVQADGSWSVTGRSCGSRGQVLSRPVGPSPVDAYARVVRLLPVPRVAVAPGHGPTLVNIETIFWVDSAADRSLGTVNLLGALVRLRISVASVAWSFGDGGSVVSPNLGRAYTLADPCSTAQCAGYFGHTYATTGAFAVRARITWRGQFSVDGGPWRDVRSPAGGAEVTGPVSTVPVRVVQARGVLIG